MKVEWQLRLRHVWQWHGHITEWQGRHGRHQHVGWQQGSSIREWKLHVTTRRHMIARVIIIVILIAVSFILLVAFVAVNTHTVEIAQLRKDLAHCESRKTNTPRNSKLSSTNQYNLEKNFSIAEEN
jgi:hypothetical protein